MARWGKNALLAAVVMAGCQRDADTGPRGDAAGRDAKGDAVVAAGVADAPTGAGWEADAEASEAEIMAFPDDALLELPGSGSVLYDGMDGAKIVRVPDGGESVGTPQHGTLSGGIQLPLNPALYTRRRPARQYGSSHAIRTIQAAFADFREGSGVTREVLIGDVSLPRGGPFAPHVSHQAGRDVDIRLILADGLERDAIPFEAQMVDWTATWALVDSFMRTGKVGYIFLDFERQSHLYKAGLEAGVDSRVLDAWFQWPDRGDLAGIIRHEDGHRAHIHVRLVCGEDESKCHGI